MSGLSERAICRDGMGRCRACRVSKHLQETWKITADYLRPLPTLRTRRFRKPPLLK